MCGLPLLDVLTPSKRVDIHPLLNPRPSPVGSHRLEMLQAYEGDLLRIVAGREAVIIDAGPPACLETIERLLRSRARCRLLLITHLDRDHYGGLHALVQRALNGQTPRRLKWPQTIWLNEFEPRGTLNALVDGLEEDGDPGALLRTAIAVANEWREQNRITYASFNPNKAPDWIDDRLPLDTSVQISVGSDVFDYLHRVLRQPDEISRGEVDPRIRYVFDVLSRAIELAPKVRSERERTELLRQVDAVFRRFEPLAYLADAPLQDPTDRLLRFGNTVVTLNRRAHAGITIRAKDADLLSSDRQRDAIMQGVPPEIGGVLHLVLDGPVLLQDLQADDESLTLVEALRAFGVKVEPAIAGHRSSPFRTDLLLQVLGPGTRELDELRKQWQRIREKGRIHVRRDMLAFLEASLYVTAHARYALDRSVTNRSSIQVLASTSSGYAVLTGDGRPDTLKDGLKDTRIHVPEAACVVFKAAHHGSPHNTAIAEPRNVNFETLKPRAVWISGNGEHPGADFVEYLERQQRHFGFSVAATNLNHSLELLRGVKALRKRPISTPL